MTARRTRSILWLATAVLLLNSAAVVALHYTQPAEIEAIQPNSSRLGEAETAEAGTTQDRGGGFNQAGLIQAAQKDIRQRLFDPPVVAPKPPPPKPLPPIELISTILRDGGQPSAWVRDGQETRKVSIGDHLGPEDNPAIVHAIQSGQLTVEHEGKPVEVAHAIRGGQRR